MGVDIVEKFIESFPYSTFPKQNGDSNYNKIQTIYKLAETDLSSVVQHIYLAIVLLNNTLHHTLIGGTFIPPTNPGPKPIIEGGLQATEIDAQKMCIRRTTGNIKSTKE